MRIVTDFIDELKSRYGESLPFKRICEDQRIIIVEANLEPTNDGFCAKNSYHTVIVLNHNLTHWERRDRAWHELWHAMKSPATGINRREEARANLFAALVRAPVVKEGDTIDSLVEKYNVTRPLAKIRIEYELRQING